MPKVFFAVFSVTLYALAFYLLLRKRPAVDFIHWSGNPTIDRIWGLWILFLILFAPLSYQPHDMRVWVDSAANLLDGSRLPEKYVYLPVYAQFVASLAAPFYAVGLRWFLLLVYCVHVPVILSYAFSAKLMADMIPENRLLAPLGIILAPVTIFYLFFGTNHILMFALLLLAIFFIKDGKFLLAGLSASLSCYKFLLVPTAIVLLFIVYRKYGRRAMLSFILGGLLALIPSALYYAYDPAPLLRILSRQGAVGFHAQHIEPFHFFHIFALSSESFAEWYMRLKVWLVVPLVGCAGCLFLYYRGRLNGLQSLGVCSGIVALFTLEPFRLEPVVGLLWLDAVYRKDFQVQTCVFLVLFAHAAAWYDMANFAFLRFDASFPVVLWQARGFILGLALMLLLAAVFLAKDKGYCILDR